MAWMLDEYAHVTGATGKPVSLGGSEGRHDATARGGLITVREAAAGMGMDLAAATVVIRGFGNVRHSAASPGAAHYDAEVVAVSDGNGAIDRPDPAAVENVITIENAERVGARIVADLANGPTTTETDEMLDQSGIHIVPDFLCNGGGVIVSCIEMIQNRTLDHWSEAEVFRRPGEKVTAAYRAVTDFSRTWWVPMRQATPTLAVERTGGAMDYRGWIGTEQCLPTHP